MQRFVGQVEHTTLRLDTLFAGLDWEPSELQLKQKAVGDVCLHACNCTPRFLANIGDDFVIFHQTFLDLGFPKAVFLFRQNITTTFQ